MKPSYLPYSENLEKIMPDEERLVAEILSVMGKSLQGQSALHKHGLRDAHSKIQGALKGTLAVYDKLPEHLRQGIFAKPREYPLVIRVSTSPNTLQSDEVNCLRAFAIKLIGVEGPQLLPEHRNERTQDFLMINSKVLPFSDLNAYLKAIKLADKKINAPVKDKLRTVKTVKAINAILKLIGKENALFKAVASPHTHILGETFHTAGVLRFGQYFGRVSLHPLAPNLRALAAVTFDPTGQPDIIREHVANFFARQTAEYELRVQLCSDLKKMPVEDPSIEWPEKLSPYQPLGKLMLPAQNALSAERLKYVDDVLSFNPWHGVEAHRPLGNLMRIRRQAYEQSSRLRHELNGLARYEPRDISDIPD